MVKMTLILGTALLLFACHSVPVYDGTANTPNNKTAEILSNKLADMYAKTGVIEDKQYNAVNNFDPYNTSWRGDGFLILHWISQGELRIRIIPCGVPATHTIEERIKTILINENTNNKYDSKCDKQLAIFN